MAIPMPAAPLLPTHVQVRFLPEGEAAPGGAILLARFSDPQPYAAYASSRELRGADGFDALPVIGAESVGALDVLFIPGGAATPYAQQQRAEAWMAKPADRRCEPTIELVLRSDRILWRSGRALVQGAGERFPELLDGLVDFAFHEGELRKLESELDRDWPAYEADIRLTHAVGDAELAEQGHVNAMTVAATRRRMLYARLERPLEKASITLPGPARRLVSELAVQAEILERMKSVDDRIEVFEDLYELANDRLSEYHYFSTELRIERWIFVVLFLELILCAWEVILLLQET
jgi:hypothetical protein